MSDTPTTAELINGIREGIMFAEGSTLEGDEGVDMIEAVLRENADPDYVTVMVSQSASSDYPGVEGFREALGDWMSPYESFRLQIDEVITLDDKLVFLVRQLATTKHDGVEVEVPSATVWWVADGRIRQAVFYLDQRAALEAAGLDPDQSRQE